MEKSLDKLLLDCNSCIKRINAQKINNLKILGQSIQILSDAFEEKQKISIYQIKQLNSEYGLQYISELTRELYRILTIQDVKQIENVQVDRFQYPFSTSFNVPKFTYQFEKEKREIFTSLFEDLHTFDPQTILEEAIKQLDKFDYSDDGPLTADIVSRQHSLLGHLLTFIIKIKEFYKMFQQIKSNFIFSYETLQQSIEAIEYFLKQNSIKVDQTQYENQDILEVEIQNILQFTQNKMEIVRMDSNFIDFFKLNVDFKSWIAHKRPLIFWQLLDRMRPYQKWKELIGYYKLEKANKLNSPYQIGFDFLLLLNESELRSIQFLDLRVDTKSDNQMIIPILRNLDSLSLKTIKLSSQFLKLNSEDKENIEQIIAFLKSQNQIEQFSIEFYYRFGIESVFDIIQQITIFSNLKILQINIDCWNLSIKQTRSIIDTIYSLKTLEYLEYSIYIDQDDIYLIDQLENIQFPSSLRKLNLTFVDGFSLISEQFLQALTQLINLLELQLGFNFTFKEQNMMVLSDIFEIIKNMKLNKINLDFQSLDEDISKSNFSKLYKLKQIVSIQLNPPLNELFNYEVYE